MSSDPKTDLINAILSMDSYNRGYGSGIKGLDPSGSIGNFTIQSLKDDRITVPVY